MVLKIIFVLFIFSLRIESGSLSYFVEIEIKFKLRTTVNGTRQLQRLFRNPFVYFLMRIF